MHDATLEGCRRGQMEACMVKQNMGAMRIFLGYNGLNIITQIYVRREMKQLQSSTITS